MLVQSSVSRPSSRLTHRKPSSSSVSPMSMSTRSSPTQPEEVTPTPEPYSYTPPEQLIPGTGGQYEDWDFHPTRIQALESNLDPQKLQTEIQDQPHATCTAADETQTRSAESTVSPEPVLKIADGGLDQFNVSTLNGAAVCFNK